MIIDDFDSFGKSKSFHFPLFFWYNKFIMGIEKEGFSEQPNIKELENWLDSLDSERENLHTRESVVVEKIGSSEVERIKTLEEDFFHQLIDERIKRTGGKITAEEYGEDLTKLSMEQILGERHEKQLEADWGKFDTWLSAQELQLGGSLQEAQELFRIYLLRKTFDTLDDQLKNKMSDLKGESEKVEEFRQELKDLEENEMPITLDELSFTIWDKSVDELSPALRQKIKEMAESSPWIIGDDERNDNLEEEKENE